MKHYTISKSFVQNSKKNLKSLLKINIPRTITKILLSSEVLNISV